MQQIGVSIAVPEPWGAQLQEYRLSVGDLAAEQIPTHITLLPPLEIPRSAMTRISAHLERIAQEHTPIQVLLRGTGTFRPISPVVFINVVAGISQMEMLAKQVRQGPLAVRTRFPYHPHVTVAQEVSVDLLDQAFTELADFEASFLASEFWLYHHDEKVGWQPERSFALA